jgi:magnesium-protoporphyrin O-methyltransferase
MSSTTYLQRRGQIERYFDRTAADAWARLTSDAPVSRIRASVRAGRDQMRNSLLAMLPLNLSGRRVLDAGCGTGTLAGELAQRGAHVVAVDLSPTLVDLARERIGATRGEGRIEFLSGDMSDPALGRFDHVVCMDSLIHYGAPDVVRVIGGLAARCDQSMVFTFAPSTPMLAVMRGVGRLFPRADRAPAIEPIAELGLRERLAAEAALRGWRAARTRRVSHGFYTSQALELTRS